MAVTISGTAEIDSVRLSEQAGDPTTPASGYWQVYAKASGLYIKDDAGVVTGPFTATGAAYTLGAHAYHDAAQAIATASATALALNSERYDTDGIHDNAVNNSRLTCQTTGKYVITANARWAADAAGTIRQVAIKLNGATEIGVVRDAPIATVQMMSVTTIYALSASDYVEVVVYQDSGGNVNIDSAGNNSPEFSMQRIG